MSESGCVFCALLAALGDADTWRNPASGQVTRKIRDLPASVVILGQDQFYRGYAVVIARTHATELYELPKPEATQYFHDLLQVARAIATAFKPRKLNYELLGNTVAHLHWHVFPRYEGDPSPLRPVWEHAHAERVPTPDEATATIAALQLAL
jgi:diadenosine tetraphosphate (Ap4A) HIT family hydrolase